MSPRLRGHLGPGRIRSGAGAGLVLEGAPEAAVEVDDPILIGPCAGAQTLGRCLDGPDDRERHAFDATPLRPGCQCPAAPGGSRGAVQMSSGRPRA
jgi:hypothetical protein